MNNNNNNNTNNNNVKDEHFNIKCSICNINLVLQKASESKLDKDNHITFHRFAKQGKQATRHPVCYLCTVEYMNKIKLDSSIKCYQCKNKPIDIKYLYRLDFKNLNHMSTITYNCSRECYDKCYQEAIVHQNLDPDGPLKLKQYCIKCNDLINTDELCVKCNIQECKLRFVESGYGPDSNRDHYVSFNVKTLTITNINKYPDHIVYKAKLDQEFPPTPIPSSGICNGIEYKMNKLVYITASASMGVGGGGGGGNLRLVHQDVSKLSESFNSIPKTTFITLGKEQDDKIIILKCKKMDQSQWSSIHSNSITNESYLYYLSTILLLIKKKKTM